MDQSKMIMWLAETLIVLVLLYLIQIPLRKGRHPFWRTIVFLIKVILIPGTALLFVAIEWQFPYTHGELLVAIYAALVADVAASIIEFFVRLFRRKKDNETAKPACLFKLNAVLSLVLCICLMGYGMFNAWNISRNTHKWQAEGLKESHTFAFAADLARDVVEFI